MEALRHSRPTGTHLGSLACRQDCLSVSTRVSHTSRQWPRTYLDSSESGLRDTFCHPGVHFVSQDQLLLRVVDSRNVHFPLRAFVLLRVSPYLGLKAHVSVSLPVWSRNSWLNSYSISAPATTFSLVFLALLSLRRYRQNLLLFISLPV